jgi:hypothetical protein
MNETTTIGELAEKTENNIYRAALEKGIKREGWQDDMPLLKEMLIDNIDHTAEDLDKWIKKYQVEIEYYNSL